MSEYITERLFALQDKKYAEFQAKLMPTVAKKVIIGVRTPELRKLSKEFTGSEEAERFLKELPHKYYEENNLHAFLIEKIKDYDKCISALNEFLPYVDNWATCDMMCPKVFKKHLPVFMEQIKEWLTSEHTYVVRFAIKMLMSFYLGEHFESEQLELVASVKSEEYYIKMMVAWYFATALAKQYEATLPYIEGRKLECWVHNKTIQKAVESYRVSDEHKKYLRELRWKE